MVSPHFQVLEVLEVLKVLKVLKVLAPLPPRTGCGAGMATLSGQYIRVLRHRFSR
jgi:hypothetical protein